MSETTLTAAGGPAPARKRCAKCGQVKPPGEFTRDASRPSGLYPYCLACRRKPGGRAWRQAEAAGLAAWGKRRCGACRRVKPVEEFGIRSARPDGLHEACRQCVTARATRYGETLKARVLDHYGWACTCCGSPWRLAIDHIGGGGTAHRIELFGRSNATGATFYRWLIGQGFPPGFQPMCARCNSSKGRGAACRLDHGTESQAAA